MNTRISLYADRIIEAGWLIAALSIPLFFNVYSSRTFEPDKLTLLRSIALVMVAAWLIKFVDTGWRRPEGETWRGWLRRHLIQTPLALPTLLMVIALLIATVFSIAPRLTFYGSYQRLQGTYTTLSYIAIFFLMLQGLRHREQVERLVTVAIISSIPVTLYGVLQNLGFDPLPWLGDVQRRIASTMGNSIFVAAYLILVVPLTLGRLLRTVQATLETDDPPTANFVLIPFYVLILVSQVIAIVFAQSRGPWLGLFGGLFFFVLLWALGLRRRWVVYSWIGVTLAVFGFLIVFNLPNSPLEPLRSAPYIGRLGRILVQNPTGDVRILIWRGTADLVTHDPLRLLIGYGPETMHVAYNPFYPPDLAHIENRNASPDRSHNETWDALVTTGLIGFVSYMALFTSLFYLGLKWLGLIKTTLQRNLFLGLWFGGGLIAAAGFVAATEPGFFGVALPAGMMLGLFAYLVWHTLTRQAVDETAAVTSYRALLVALYSAMIAHFIEIHFGIAIAATRTYFWMYCALLVAIGYLWRIRPGLAEVGEETGTQVHREAGEPGSVGVGEPGSRGAGERGSRGAGEPGSRGVGAQGRRGAGAQQPAVGGRKSGSRVTSRRPLTPHPSPLTSWFPRELTPLSLMVGVMLVVMIFDFYAPAAGINFNWHMGWLFTFSWVFATPIILAEGANPPKTGPDWLRALASHALISIGWALPYLVLHGIAFARPTAESIALAPLPLYIYLTLSLLVLAAALIRGETLPKPWIADMRGLVYPFLALFIAALIFATNLRVVSADILYKQAWVNFHQRRMYDPALRLYNEALKDQPSQDFYLLFKGKALLEKAQSSADAPIREATFQEAKVVLEQAQNLNPLNTDHSANLARMYQTWASFATTPQERDQRTKKALEYYDEALRLSPNNALIWNQKASAYLDTQNVDEALKTLDTSLNLDAEFHDTYLRLMDAYAQKGDMTKVQSAYDMAVKLQPRSTDPHLVLGDIARVRQDWPKAIEAYRRAVTVEPRSAPARSSLALALAQGGQRDAAIQENLEVLKLAPNDPSTLRNLALLYREAGNLNEALKYARRALEQTPNNQPLTDFIKELEGQGAK